jgi:hypothetical protein
MRSSGMWTAGSTPAKAHCTAGYSTAAAPRLLPLTLWMLGSQHSLLEVQAAAVLNLATQVVPILPSTPQLN